MGGGPAGALAGALLAAGGKKVLLFDEKLAWEKPCGGGITYKALQRYPFLGAAHSEYKAVEQCELISPSGQRARFPLRYPVAIFSRFVLNEIMLEKARSAGAELRKERVTRISGAAGEWLVSTPQGECRASYVVLAAGARNPFRGQFAKPIPADDLMVTAGYFIPGRCSLMQIQFLKGISGYIWIFPRADHVSAGIVGKMGETSTAALRRMLEQWLASTASAWRVRVFIPTFFLPFAPGRSRRSKSAAKAGRSSATAPAWWIRSRARVCTMPCARRSFARAPFWREKPAQYGAQLEEEILPELKLAARVSQRFYSGQVFGESVLERMVALTRRSATCRELMCDLFAGIQGYRDLRSRLYRSLPAMMAEVLASRLRGALRIRRLSTSSA